MRHQATMEKLDRRGMILLGMGVLFVLAGFVYPRMWSADQVWAPEEEAKTSQAGQQYHQLAHEYAKAVGTPDEAAMKQKVEQARTKWESQKAKVDRARSGLSWVANSLHYFGLALCIAAVFMLLASR
jgi:hypothetical protein